MKLTNNFSLEEFECKCGCKMPEFVKKNISELANNLQVLRDAVGRLDLTNAYRCKEHNADVGGSTNSQHLKGKAADIKSKAFNPSEIATITDDLMKNESFTLGGVGIYNTFTHVDIRGTRARWSKTNKKMMKYALYKKMSCWKGWEPKGKKKSPSGKKTASGEIEKVNNCVKIKKK